MFNAPVDGTRRGRARKRLLYLAVGASSVCLFFVAYGAFLAWDSYHRLPHVYAVLRARGVPATAHLVRCAPGIGIYRGVRCRLSLRLDGRLRTWDYPEDSAQFKSVESAISELQSRDEPRLEGVISRLERRRAEIVAALASKGRPEQ